MILAKISKKLRIKWNFELTVFELTVPDLYLVKNLSTSEIDSFIFLYFQLFPWPNSPIFDKNKSRKHLFGDSVLLVTICLVSDFVLLKI